MLKNLIYFKKAFLIIKKFGLEKFLFLGFLILCAVIIELFSIALVIPILTIMQNENFVKDYFGTYEFINNLSHAQEIYLVIGFLCAVFVFKFFFLLILNYNQNKYTSHLQANISAKLMKQYIFMPYSNYFKRNTSEFIRNVKDESGSFVYGVISPLLNLIIEILIVIGISLLLFFQLEFKSFLILAILAIFLLIYIKLTKNIINKLGKERFIFDEQIIKKSNEIFQSIRDIKIYFLQNKFLKDYSNVLINYASSVKKFLTLQTLPRLTVELTLIIILSLVIVFLTADDINFDEAIVTLGFFAAAAFRLLPSINRIITSQQILRFHALSIVEVYKETKKDYSLNKFKLFKKVNFEKKLELKNITFGYNSKKKIFKKLSLKINSGERIGIIGPTGTGKSTIIDIISGLLTTYSGKIIIDSQLINFNKYYWAENIGYVSQDSALINSSIKFNIAFGNEANNKNNHNKIYEVLKDVELFSYVKTLKNKLNSTIGERGIDLSGGQKQRINLARALFKNPQLLILDEAFSALDNLTENKILKKISSKYKKTAIINIAHKGSSLTYCDKIYAIKDCKLVRVK